MSNENLVNYLNLRELNLINKDKFNKNFLNYLYSELEFSPVEEYSFRSSINHLALDPSNTFMIISDASGKIHIYEVKDNNEGYLEFINSKKLSSNMVHRSQWMPNDNGMLGITQSNIYSLIDTNTFEVCDSYKFNNDSFVYWTDWNSNDLNLIAVAMSKSCIRFIDIRTGNSVQQITTKSPIDKVNHNITRILWTPFDKECLFAGDSSGYIHIYDIRRLKNALQVVGEDYTSCDSISSLDFNPKKTSILVTQGIKQKTTMWSFKRKKLRNTNVNFSSNINIKNSAHKIDKSAFIKYQIYVTDDFLFKPNFKSYNEISVYDLNNGKNLNSFSSKNRQSTSFNESSCIQGLYEDYNILYSASKNILKLWNKKTITDEEQEEIDKLHQDNWSDSD